MVGDVLRLGLAMFSVSKHLNRVKKIPIVVALNSANLRVCTVHMNSDMIFGVIFMMLSDSK